MTTAQIGRRLLGWLGTGLALVVVVGVVLMGLLVVGLTGQSADREADR